jgi:hypothetical protein
MGIGLSIGRSKMLDTSAETDAKLANEYLKEARQCEYYASLARDADRQSWISLATKWHRLADYAEKRA